MSMMVIELATSQVSAGCERPRVKAAAEVPSTLHAYGRKTIRGAACFTGPPCMVCIHPGSIPGVGSQHALTVIQHTLLW